MNKYQEAFNYVFGSMYIEIARQSGKSLLVESINIIRDLFENYSMIEIENQKLKKENEELKELAHENASLHTKVESLQSEDEKLFKEFLDKENQKLKEAFNRVFDEDTYGLNDISYIKDGVIYKKDEELIKQLIDKETPMKVKDIHVDEFYCPNCQEEITHYIGDSWKPKYCVECGQRLDWSENHE